MQWVSLETCKGSGKKNGRGSGKNDSRERSGFWGDWGGQIFLTFYIYFFLFYLEENLGDYANANPLCGLKRAYDAEERRQCIEAMKNNRITF